MERNDKGMGGGGSDAAEQTLNALLTEMDGFTINATKPVIIVAATNLVDVLDDALRRRFDRDIEVDKPDRNARNAYLTHRLTGPLGDVSAKVIDRLAGQTANMTIADLSRIIEQAGRLVATQGGKITDERLEEAFNRMRMGEASKQADPENLLRVARHEAGHCLISWLHGKTPTQVTIVARGNTGGFVESEVDENRLLYTQSELEELIQQSMGGRAAEIIHYGEKDGLSSGVAGDLESATHYAKIMVQNYGMGEGVGHIAINQSQLHDGPIAMRIMQSMEKIISVQLKEAVSLLLARQNQLDHLASKLMEKNRLTTEEIEVVLGGAHIPQP